ncbi:amidase, partial [bacterium]|nr:amidase [bacterium]
MKKQIGCFLPVVFIAFAFLAGMAVQNSTSIITLDMVASAEKIIGLEFSDAKRDSMIDGLQEQLGNYENMRKVSLANSV